MARPLLLLALIALSGEAHAKDSATQRVQVGGAIYRVTVEDGAVIVARKSLVVRYDMRERDAQREAARIATGCAVVDEMPSVDGRLRGKLDCAAR